MQRARTPAAAATAAASDPTTALAGRYRCALERLENAVVEARDLVAELVPAQPGTRVKPCLACGTPRPVRSKRASDLDGVDVAADGRCGSCCRDARHLAPIETRPDGARYYADMCRWCGSFRGQHGIDPPIPLLPIRHRGARVTPADIETHVPSQARGARARKRGWRKTPRSDTPTTERT